MAVERLVLRVIAGYRHRMRVLPFIVLLVLSGCSSSSSSSDASPDTNLGSDANSTTSDAGTEDAGSRSDTPNEPDVPVVSEVWCASGQIADPDGEPVEITDLGSSREVLHAVGQCGTQACWFTADASGGTWLQTAAYRDATAASFVDLGCTPTHCFGATATTAHVSDGETLSPVEVPDLGGSSIVAVGAGFVDVALAGDGGELWYRADADSVWDTLDVGQINDFGSHAGTLRYGFGDQVVQLNAGVWSVTDFAEDLRFGALAFETIFATSGPRYVAINSGFNRTATYLDELGRVAAFQAPASDVAIITAGDRIIGADTADGANPSNQEVAVPPQTPFVGVAYTVSGAPWAVTSGGVLYSRVAGDCRP